MYVPHMSCMRIVESLLDTRVFYIYIYTYTYMLVGNGCSRVGVYLDTCSTPEFGGRCMFSGVTVVIGSRCGSKVC